MIRIEHNADTGDAYIVRTYADGARFDEGPYSLAVAKHLCPRDAQVWNYRGTEHLCERNLAE